ncbi:hypothetical protein [Asticcacaulis solisilvae]|uniref:hypothetical protein n=1 Tax=Asticcacaulis solisilvae TaxID=1217274 RepID=UPI003FD81437
MNALSSIALRPENDVIRLVNAHKPSSTQPRYLRFDETDFTRHIRQVMSDWETRYRCHEILPGSKKERAEVRLRLNKPLLVRRFIRGSFEYGGRYSGWWMEMSAERRSAITFNSEKTVELDFQCSSPRIAYALEGRPLEPDEDAYILPGALGQRYDREAIKVAFATLFYTFKKGSLSRPAGIKIPRGEKFDDVVQLVERVHSNLEPWFRKGRIAEIERVESDIATLVMEIFTYDLRRPILSVHDGFIVAEADEKTLGLAMGYAFNKVIKTWTGLNCLPSIKGFRSEDLAPKVLEKLELLASSYLQPKVQAVDSFNRKGEHSPDYV